MKRLALLLLALSSLIAFADEYCYDDSFCDDQACFSIGVEYLYFQPCIHDPYFLVEMDEVDNDDPNGKRYAHNLPFHSGVRVKGAYNLSCYCVELYAEGFWLGDKHTRTVFAPAVNGDFLGGATKGHPSADATSISQSVSTITYDIWSAKGGFRKCFNTCSPFMAAGRFGLHYAQIYYKEFTDDIPPAEIVQFTSRSQTWGVGPELGFDVGYKFLPCLAFVVRGSYGLLVGQARSNTVNVDLDNLITDSARNEKHCLVFPVPELKAGFLYDLPFQCICASLEIGYDILRYTDMLDVIRWIGDADSIPAPGGGEALSLDYVQPFMLHGLYVSLSASF